MTPIDKIKEGILCNDMEEIIQGFMALTGEEIRPEGDPNPDPAKKPEESKPERAAEETVQPPVQVRSKDLDFSTKPRESESRFGKREPIVVGDNQFIDDGTEDRDVKTPDVGRTTRRPPVKMIEVQCHVCGDSEMINASYKSGEFHRCGKCVGA
tara:strand:+ start:1443 stop:1904 length:462 start_codon:yes stop_codon:yes gene_type:complete